MTAYLASGWRGGETIWVWDAGHLGSRRRRRFELRDPDGDAGLVCLHCVGGLEARELALDVQSPVVDDNPGI